jgi:hypothetical protein
MKKLLFAAAAITSVSAANAVLLYGQGPDASGLAYISQNLTDDASLSTYLFDDFTVPVNFIWTITMVKAYGDEGGVASTTTGTHVRIQSTPGFGAGTTYGTMDNAGAGGLSGGNLTRTGSIVLGAGHYYISVWIDRSFTNGGQWNWKQSTPVAKDSAYAHNPGGALIGTPNVVHIHDVTGSPPVDLAFELSGTEEVVPEPATFLAIGVGLAALAARRRK